MNSSSKSKTNPSQNKDGVLLVDKRAGITSFDVLRDLKREGYTDIGHGGTLDPFATGLLTVFVGRGLKLSEYLLKSNKSYSATVQLGQTTESGDNTNPVTETSPVLPQSIEQIQSIATQMESAPYLQTPPMFSAKKVDGKKLYELARQGKTVEREHVSCKLKNFTIESYDPNSGIATFSVEVSSGTFIRTLAQDLAIKLGTVGMLTTLRRSRSGPFDIKDAGSFTSCEQLCRSIFPVVSVDSITREMAYNGQQVNLFDRISKELGTVPQASENVALFCEDTLLGVIKRADNAWVISKIFRE